MSFKGNIVSKEEMDRCATLIVAKLHASPQRRVLIGIAGRPGGGKTTVAELIAAEVRRRLLSSSFSSFSGEKNDDIVVVMPMDGYHFYRKTLNEMPNREEAIARRGAEWTFDPCKLCKDLQAIRLPATDININIHNNNNNNNNNVPLYSDVLVPSFDHKVGDPVEHDIRIPGSARVIIAEGNYLLYKGTPAWAEVNRCFDMTIFLSCSPSLCAARLCRRHMAAWGISREVAMGRANGSDAMNGNLVDSTKRNADFVMHSIECANSKM